MGTSAEKNDCELLMLAEYLEVISSSSNLAEENDKYFRLSGLNKSRTLSQAYNIVLKNHM